MASGTGAGGWRVASRAAAGGPSSAGPRRCAVERSQEGRLRVPSLLLVLVNCREVESSCPRSAAVEGETA